MRVAVLMLVLLLAGGHRVPAAQTTASPRLRADGLPAQVADAFGGGEVVLELAVDARGAVARVAPLRVTPPYGDAVIERARTWQFEPATRVADGGLTAIPSAVLVVALFRPPSIYAGPAPGAVPAVHGRPSPLVPAPLALTMPSYPPNTTGDAMVLVEIAMTSRAEPLDYRIVSPPTGFDAAALEAVRLWRFAAPTAAGLPDRLYVYGAIGFRTPIVR